MRSLDDIASELDAELRTRDNREQQSETCRARIGKLLIEARDAWTKETGNIRGFYTWASERLKRSPDTLKLCASSYRHPGLSARENRRRHQRRQRQRELGRIAADELRSPGDRLTALRSAYLLLSTEDRRKFREWIKNVAERLEPDPPLVGAGRPRNFTEEMRL